MMNKEERQILLRLILKETQWVRNKEHRIPNGELGYMLDRYNLTRDIFINITPEICIRIKCDPHDRNLKLDLREIQEGDTNCEHDFIKLYWETGGSCMDSGKPHSYEFCFKCGLHRTFIKSFFERIYRLCVKN